MESNINNVLDDAPISDSPSVFWKLDNAEKWFNRFFQANETNELQLSRQERISDLRKCVRVHLSYLKHNEGVRVLQPYYERLKQIRTKLETK